MKQKFGWLKDVILMCYDWHDLRIIKTNRQHKKQ